MWGQELRRSTAIGPRHLAPPARCRRGQDAGRPSSRGGGSAGDHVEFDLNAHLSVEVRQEISIQFLTANYRTIWADDVI